MVPFEKNEYFVGRADLLKQLSDALCCMKPRQYNHRVALFGMGGVGKTQTVLSSVLDDHGSLDPLEAVDLNNPCQDRIDLNQLLEAICRSWIKSIWNRLVA